MADGGRGPCGNAGPVGRAGPGRRNHRSGWHGSGVGSPPVMEKLGSADQLKAKTKFIDGIRVAEVVAKGEVEIGLQQINVILPVKGADYIGPLPKELQETVKFSAGVLTTSKQPEVAKAFLKFITSAEAAPLLRKSGMEPWH